MSRFAFKGASRWGCVHPKSLTLPKTQPYDRPMPGGRGGVFSVQAEPAAIAPDGDPD
ncbi:hypothetical protein [Prochlorothrix hollandica]|uniref:hypothetical protein n=1 Tax=Prochlorothrix hollandica TaxID=1223 RepID=UPI0012B66E88|nr:hypothetical protein [Prochlorothrix hollandica]